MVRTQLKSNLGHNFKVLFLKSPKSRSLWQKYVFASQTLEWGEIESGLIYSVNFHQNVLHVNSKSLLNLEVSAELSRNTHFKSKMGFCRYPKSNYREKK